MLTVLTWLWEQPGGRTRYTTEHVNIWADMIDRHLEMPHRLAVVSDCVDPSRLRAGVEVVAPPPFEHVALPTWPPHMPQCLRRLTMHRPDAEQWFGPRFVCTDLDCVVSGPLDPLFDRPEDFVMYRGTTESRPYNGSMMMTSAGARSQIWTEFTPSRAVAAAQRYLGSDQSWISAVLGSGEATWDAADGVHAWGSRRNVGDPRITFFLSANKPWDMKSDEPWIADHYRRDLPGRCLVLGYGPTVWDDAIAAGDGPWDAVLSSPEAAEHCEAPGWRWGPVTAVCRSDEHGLEIARRMGYAPERTVLCGATVINAESTSARNAA